jgi:Spy/CpxP family protein refolding chaperone
MSLPTGNDYIVTVESAAPTLPTVERAGISADHSHMVKFESPHDQGFRLAADAIQRYSEQAIREISQRQALAQQRLDVERRREILEIAQNGDHRQRKASSSSSPTWLTYR